VIENEKAPGPARIFHAPYRPEWLENRMEYARWARCVLGFKESNQDAYFIEWGMKNKLLCIFTLENIFMLPPLIREMK
jgi:hypothetical protein